MRISELPRPYREKAEYYQKTLANGKEDKNCLYSAFVFNSTEEGHEYWRSCHNASHMSELPEPPSSEGIEDDASLGETFTISKYSKQIGGDHYKKYEIQPTEFIVRNDIDWLEGNVIKYVVRHQDKGGKDDLQKAIHNLQLLIEEKYS